MRSWSVYEDEQKRILSFIYGKKGGRDFKAGGDPAMGENHTPYRASNTIDKKKLRLCLTFECYRFFSSKSEVMSGLRRKTHFERYLRLGVLLQQRKNLLIDFFFKKLRLYSFAEKKRALFKVGVILQQRRNRLYSDL